MTTLINKDVKKSLPLRDNFFSSPEKCQKNSTTFQDFQDHMNPAWICTHENVHNMILVDSELSWQVILIKWF